MLRIFSAVYVIFSLSCAKANYQEASSDLTQLNAQNQKCASQLSAAGLCVDLVWEQLPTMQDRGVFRLNFYKADSPLVMVEPALTPHVLLWMPSMGHGSMPVKVEKVSEGMYRVTDVFFVMAGEWEIHVQQKDGKTVLDEAVIPFVFEE